MTVRDHIIENAHVEGRKVKALRWRNTGDTPEGFPEIK